jgi:hypothetical protein
MSDGNIPTRQLWCLVVDDVTPFDITISANANIWQLKELIREERKHGALATVDAKDLVLWKVRTYQRLA